MPFNDTQAIARANELREESDQIRKRLDPVRRYWTGKQALPPVVPSSAPAEVRTMARIARVNVCDIVVESLVQSLIVEGFRAEMPEDPQQDDSPLVDATLPVWRAWQANRMDKRQVGIHAAASAYGRAYTVVLPSTGEYPVIRGVSPRSMVAMFGDDPDWPVHALERRSSTRWVLYDEQNMFRFKTEDGGDLLQLDSKQPHGQDRAPVVRYIPEDDLDEDDEPSPHHLFGGLGREEVDLVAGQVAPMVNLQDQIDIITFNLLVAQHYTAFRQRYAIGWTDANEAEAMKAAASQLWAFKDHPDDLKLGEFEQTNLSGYIDSREASLKYAATLSQTPVHELIGELVNLSAEALAAAEAGRDRKVDLHKIGIGESHEQTLWLAGRYMSQQVPSDAQVVWRDTSARAFGAIVDGLGKLATMLGMPPQELWDRVPGFTQQDIRRMKVVAEQGDAFADLAAMLDRQADGLNA